MLVLAIRVVEYINIAITALFLFFYIFRFLTLRHFSVTDRYKSKYPKARFLVSASYMVLAVPFLVISIYEATKVEKDSEFWLIEEGVGEFVDALILIIQCLVLKDELSKERPYTVIHVIFSIYLALLGVARLGVVLAGNAQYNTVSILAVGFYAGFLVNSAVILLYWVAKRQELPQFEENKYFSFEEFRATNSSRYMINRNIEVSYMRKISDSFHYIHPIVSVEKSKFRITLEIYDDPHLDDTELLERTSSPIKSMNANANMKQRQSMNVKQRQRQSINVYVNVNVNVKQGTDVKQSMIQNTNTSNNRNGKSKREESDREGKKGMRVISSQIYTMAQILELYKICGRFDIKQKVGFDSNNLGETYKSLQNYLEELFSVKKHYLDIILQFFCISEEIMARYDREMRMTLKGSQLDMQAHLDCNASIMSVKIYKQLWVEDYYLFYMDVVALDGSCESRPMKRYSDFEALNDKLSGIIRKKYGKLLLPELPKKYLFNWDESKITQRRVELECFLSNICNDHQLMLHSPDLRQCILDFLLCKKTLKLQPQCERALEFIQKLEVLKGDITKHLIGNEYVTFYQFRFVKNGIPLRTIKKRYSDFEALHGALHRHMHNTQIYYKFVALPEKHLYKSGPIRHDKLHKYLGYVLTIPDAYKIYDLVCFLNLDSSLGDLDVSGINASHPMPMEDEQFVHDSSYSSNQRMSALIDELGG